MLDSDINFVKQMESFTIPELLSLLNHKNSVVKGYASWALADRKYTKLYEILNVFLKSGETVSSKSADQINQNDLSAEFYSRVYYQNIYNKLTSSDSVFFCRSVEKMDSLILFSSLKTDLINVVLEHNNAKPSTYNRVKELAVEKNVPSAIVALAEYKQQKDIPTIISFGERSFSAISVFPDQAFWNLLLSYRDKIRTQEYFQAISSYKTKNSNEVLNEIYSSCDSIQINHLDEALIKNYNFIYQDLILKIWANYKTIDLTGTKKLLSDCPEKASLPFSIGLSNKKRYNLLELDYNYGTADSILPLMIENVAYYQKAKILEICKNNIQVTSFMDLVAFLNFVKKNKITGTIETLLSRLKTKNYPFDIFEITETLLSFKNSDVNKELKTILTNNRNVWDSGNWSESFQTLLKENNIIL
jgi:hypothetical protein